MMIFKTKMKAECKFRKAVNWGYSQTQGCIHRDNLDIRSRASGGQMKMKRCLDEFCPFGKEIEPVFVKKPNKVCACCGTDKNVPNDNGRGLELLCSRCSVYCKDLKREILGLKYQLNSIRLKFYGYKLKWKNEK